MLLVKAALLWSLPLWICVAPQLRADVTLRYKTDMKMADFLPRQAKDEAAKKIGDASFSLQMKDGKGVARNSRFISVVDFQKQEMTVMDPEHKTFATIPSADFMTKFASLMPQMPEDAKKALAAMKTNVESKQTGRTETISGVAAEEREVTLTLDIPLPAGSPQAALSMKMVMHIWTAKQEETLRVPAIQELTAYNLWGYSMMNPAGMSQKMLATMPGFGETFSRIVDEFGQHKAVMLRMSMSMYMPMSPEVLKKLSEQNPGGPAMDPAAPMFTMTQEVSELSSVPVDAAAFKIPGDYKTAGFEDVWKAVTSAPMAGAGSAPAQSH